MYGAGRDVNSAAGMSSRLPLTKIYTTTPLPRLGPFASNTKTKITAQLLGSTGGKYDIFSKAFLSEKETRDSVFLNLYFLFYIIIYIFFFLITNKICAV